MGWIRCPEDLLQWAGPAYTHPLDREQLEANFQQSLGENPSRLIFRAVDSSTSSVVGHVELGNVTAATGRYVSPGCLWEILRTVARA